jgi:ankyrin repeat protein
MRGIGFGALLLVLPSIVWGQLTPEAIYQALRVNDLTTIRQIAADKTLVNAKDAKGSTPLMHACGVGSLEAMQILLAGGADVKAKNGFDATALHWCATDEQRVRLLLGRRCGCQRHH